MIPIRIRKRLHIPLAIVLIYLTTVALVSAYSYNSLSSAAFAMLLASIGSLIIYILLHQWEINLTSHKQAPSVQPKLHPSVAPLRPNENYQALESALLESQTKHRELVEELNVKNEVLHKLEGEKAQFEHRMEDIHHELNRSKSSSEEELRRKAVLLSEYQETINQQRDVIKKRQDQITELETKVRDLNYEVKTLLQVAELSDKTPSPYATNEMFLSETAQTYQVTLEGEDLTHKIQDLIVKSPEEATQQLKRCIDIAQKITGANRFGAGSSRFRDLPIDNRALDLRGLFDNLRSENAGTIIVYSLKEDKILFANDQTSNLLGWSPEKFMKNFPEIISEGFQEWKKGIGELSGTAISQIRMVMKTKSGQNLLLHCHLGVIPTGAFRNHVIGILFSC